jgi:hypothetical protein
MNIKSERGQAEMAIVFLLAIIVIAALFGMMAANQRGMQAGAESIGDAEGDAITGEELTREMLIEIQAVCEGLLDTN